MFPSHYPLQWRAHDPLLPPESRTLLRIFRSDQQDASEHTGAVWSAHHIKVALPLSKNQCFATPQIRSTVFLLSSEALKSPSSLVDSYQHCRITCSLHLHSRITLEGKNCARHKEKGKFYLLKIGVLKLFFVPLAPLRVRWNLRTPSQKNACKCIC